MDKIPSQFLAEIIAQQLDMPRGSVWLRDQNRKIPNDNGLYIVVGLISAQPMASETSVSQQAPSNWDQDNSPAIAGTPERFDQPGQKWDQAPVLYETQRVNVQEMIQVDVLSRSNEILYRQWEVIAALQSIYAQQVMEFNNFKIFRIPRSFVNTSSAEGGSQLNRYSLTFPCFVWYSKTRVLKSPLGDYFDDFETKVYTTGRFPPSPITNWDHGGFWDNGVRYDQFAGPSPDPGLEVIAEFEIDQEGTNT